MNFFSYLNNKPDQIVSTDNNFVELDSWYFVIHSCDYQASNFYQAIYKGGSKVFEKQIAKIGFGYGLIFEDTVLDLIGNFKDLNIFTKHYINNKFIIQKKCELKKNCNNVMQGLNLNTLLCENCIQNCEFCEIFNLCTSCKSNLFLNQDYKNLPVGNCLQDCPFNHIKDDSSFFIAQKTNRINLISDTERVFNPQNFFLFADEYKLYIVNFPLRMFFFFLKKYNLLH